VTAQDSPVDHVSCGPKFGRYSADATNPVPSTNRKRARTPKVANASARINT